MDVKSKIVLGLFVSLVVITSYMPVCAQNTDSKEQIILISPKQYNLDDLNVPNPNSQNIRKPNLTDADTKQLSYTLRGLFSSIYVNQDYILTNYSLQRDILNLSNISSDKKLFMLSARNIFDRLNDLHSAFGFGYPYSCFISGFPIKVVRIYNAETQKYAFVISEKGDLNAILKAIENKQYADQESEIYYKQLNIQKIKENFNKLKIGDQLLSIRGLAAKSNHPNLQDLYKPREKYYFIGEPHYNGYGNHVVDKLSDFTRTHDINKGATLSRVSEILFSRFGGTMQIPGSSNIEDTFTIETTQETLTFPWFTLLSSDALNDPEQRCPNMIDRSYGANTNAKVYADGLSYPSEIFFDAISIDEKKDDSTVIKSIINNGDNQFLYIKFKLFLPQKFLDFDYKNARLQILKSIKEIKNFISDNQSNIKGVIIDIRDNPGGYGSYATLLAKLFKADIKNDYKDFLFYPLQSKANYEIYNNLKNNISSFIPGISAIDSKIIESIFSKIFLKLTPESDNSFEYNKKLAVLSQNFDSDPNDSFSIVMNAIQKTTNESEPLKEYLDLFDSTPFLPGNNKPIALLINGSTFSAGDVFTSLFRDYNIGKIYGEDTGSSGGGGANIIFYNQFQTAQGGIVPLFNENGLVPGKLAPPTPNDIFFSFAWNRVIRSVNCEKNNDCENPNAKNDFVENYPLNSNKYDSYVNGIPVDSQNILSRSVADLTEQNLAKKPIFQKIMQDMVR